MSFMNAIHHFLADEETSKTVFLKYFLRVPIFFRLYIKIFMLKCCSRTKLLERNTTELNVCSIKSKEDHSTFVCILRSLKFQPGVNNAHIDRVA